MRSWIPLALTVAVLLCVPESSAAQKTDSLQWQFQQWKKQHEDRLLPDTAYLRKIDSVVFYCFDRSDFPQMIEPYRLIVFNDTAFNNRRITYYQYRGIHSVNNISIGSAVFYFGKMADESALQHNTARELAANRAMITIFSSNDFPEKCIERYNIILPVLRKQADSAAAGKSTGIMVENVTGILQAMIALYYDEKKYPEAHEAEVLLHRVMEAVNRDPEKYQPFLGKILVVASSAAFEKAAWDTGDHSRAPKILNETIAHIKYSGMHPSLQPFFLYDEYHTAIRFFMKEGNTDSARKYLQLSYALDLPLMRDKKEQFYHEQMAELLGKTGQYAKAWEHSTKALKLKDSLLQATLKDRNNNVYAQTENEHSKNQVSKLTDANHKAEETRLFLINLIITSLIILLALFFWYRQKQKSNFLNAKLRMARNIHDEIGPMLLFIKLMAKKEKETVGASAYLQQMDTTISNVMETVRGLSHDLKSEVKLSTQQLYEEVKTLLNKTESLTGISYHFSFNKKDKPLNYFQYQHLRNIFSELVNNTIKHAEWSRIDLMLKVEAKKIYIVYTDNGLGFEPAYEDKNGIGLANIRERVEKLRGQIELRNNYPEGYSIEINIPFE